MFKLLSTDVAFSAAELQNAENTAEKVELLPLVNRFTGPGSIPRGHVGVAGEWHMGMEWFVAPPALVDSNGPLKSTGLRNMVETTDELSGSL